MNKLFPKAVLREGSGRGIEKSQPQSKSSQASDFKQLSGTIVPGKHSGLRDPHSMGPQSALATCKIRNSSSVCLWEEEGGGQKAKENQEIFGPLKYWIPQKEIVPESRPGKKIP